MLCRKDKGSLAVVLIQKEKHKGLKAVSVVAWGLGVINSWSVKKMIKQKTDKN